MIKKTLLLSVLISTTFFVSCNDDDDNSSSTVNSEYFLVANRGSGTVTVFDAKTQTVSKEITLPGSGAQPTYLAYSDEQDRFYVGDFINQQIVIYDDESFAQVGTVAIQEGAFHMMSSDIADQLWVNNIVSKTTSVVDLNTDKVLETISLPTNIGLTENAVQHDVTISSDGMYAYVTILDGSDTSYVVQYKTSDYSYVKHATVGGDAHLQIVGSDLYVPSQEDGIITIFSQSDLTQKTTLTFEGTHGVAAVGDYFFTAGLPAQTLGVFNTTNNQLISSIDAAYATPHNLAVSADGNYVFLSHSGGSATKVVFYQNNNGTLTRISDYDSGINPFGVLYFNN